MNRTILAWSVALAAIGSAACKKDEAPTVAPLASPDGAVAARPGDRLAPGELLEGDDHVFGLTLPRGLRIEASFADLVIASGAPKAEDVANYFRPRVSMGAVKVGAASTIFDRVQAPANPGRELLIRVEQLPNGVGSQVTLRDVTPPLIDPNLTEEQRWRQVGAAPGGKILDPAHLH